MLREIATHAHVDVAALVHSDDEAAHAGDLKELADEVIVARVPRFRNFASASIRVFGGTALTHVLLDSPSMTPSLRALVDRRRPDVTLAFCSSMARFALEGPLSGVPCVVDLIDADSSKWADLGALSRGPRAWVYRREATLIGAYETRIMRQARATLVVNEKERAALLAHEPQGRVTVIENGIDRESFAPPGEPMKSADVVFCGMMDYEPNAQGALWLAREVWPIVRAARSDARLMIVGAAPATEVLALHRPDSGVVVTGAVDDVRKYLWEGAVSAAPLRVARGVQNKVLEAVASGLPCVVTPAVADGLPADILPACVVGRDARGFASALTQLLGMPPAERRAVAARADLTPLLWSTRLRPLMPILQAAAAGRRE
jgi:sugar transferase (PEP-CTERM/EpsH1 system associated)